MLNPSTMVAHSLTSLKSDFTKPYGPNQSSISSVFFLISLGLYPCLKKMQIAAYNCLMSCRLVALSMNLYSLVYTCSYLMKSSGVHRILSAVFKAL